MLNDDIICHISKNINQWLKLKPTTELCPSIKSKQVDYHPEIVQEQQSNRCINLSIRVIRLWYKIIIIYHFQITLMEFLPTYIFWTKLFGTMRDNWFITDVFYLIYPNWFKWVVIYRFVLGRSISAQRACLGGQMSLARRLTQTVRYVMDMWELRR